MQRIRALILGTVAFLVCRVATGQQSSKAVTLEITEQAGNYVLTVPVSRLVMTIPKGGLSRVRNLGGGSTDSPRYFHFGDDALHLIVSGWFESDQGFSGIEQFWANETAAWKRQNLPGAQDVSFEKLGSWNSILYDTAVPGEQSSHIRAHWLQAGTWIDIHLSLTADLPQAERRGKLRDALKAIEISEKKQSDQTPEEAARQVAESWLLLLDSERYAESWEELSPNGKAKLSKGQWELAMEGMRKPLGKPGKRKFDKAQYMKSLHGYPDQEGVIVRFETAFENRKAVIESVGTIHDKDGEWRVIAYVTN